MDDYISKASVCEILADIYPTDGEKFVPVKVIDKAYEAMLHLPSAQSEEGEWIQIKGCTIECSICHEAMTSLSDEYPNYCCHCGTKMKK